METVWEQAVEILNQGGIIIFPTDTAYGIGCRIDMARSVDRLFKIRKRPHDQAMPILVSSAVMAKEYYSGITPKMNQLINSYWPGALTIVAKCRKDKIYAPIRGGGNTVGLRMPNSKDLLLLISAVGVPILGPSANFHGSPTPFSKKQLDPELLKLVDWIIPGICILRQVSTVVDCSGNKIRIIRQGAVKISI